MKHLSLVVAIALAGGAGSCQFAHNHPGITSGIAVGAIAIVPCLPAVEHPTTCLAIGAVAGLALGGIMGLVTTFADTSAHELPPDEPVQDPDVVRTRTSTPPPPGLPPAMANADAGVADAGVADAAAAPVDSAGSD